MMFSLKDRLVVTSTGRTAVLVQIDAACTDKLVYEIRYDDTGDKDWVRVGDVSPIRGPDSIIHASNRAGYVVERPNGSFEFFAFTTKLDAFENEIVAKLWKEHFMGAHEI